MWISTLYFFRTCVFNGILCKILCRHVYVYLDNPLVQNYRLKSETAIIIAGCLNFPVSILFAVSVSTFWALDLFRFVFFAVSLGFFAVSKSAKHMQNDKIQKLFRGRKTCRQHWFLKKHYCNFAYVGRRIFIYYTFVKFNIDFCGCDFQSGKEASILGDSWSHPLKVPGFLFLVPVLSMHWLH